MMTAERELALLGMWQEEIPYEKPLVSVENYTRFHSNYFDEAFDQEELIARARRELGGGEGFDTFVGTGLSGTTVVPVLAREFDKDFVIVRKSKEGSHSYNMVEGKLGRKWVFVDDFMSTGKTAQMVDDKVKDAAGNRRWPTKCVGSYLYGREGWVPCQGTRLCACLKCQKTIMYRVSRDNIKNRYGVDIEAA